MTILCHITNVLGKEVGGGLKARSIAVSACLQDC
nr:MAG TPA: hypothetical protein [Caudoviricetes sp.]